MKTRRQMKSSMALAASAMVAAGALLAAPVIEEPFDYESGTLAGQDGGTGWGGPWASTRGTPEVPETNNSWGGLSTSGNRVNSQAWSVMHRPIGTSLSDAGLLDDGATLWFSYVIDILNQNTTNLDYNFALCSDNFVNDYGQKTNLMGNSEGIGVGNFRPDIKGAYWQDDGDGDGWGERVMSNDSLTLNGTDNSRALIVGKIEWGATPADPETLTLYAPGLDLDLGTPFLDPLTATWPTPIPALDQSQFDRLSIQWKDSQPSIDEIRFGATSADVLPPDVAPPVANALSPEDEADGAPGSDVLVFSDLVVTFDEGVYAGTGTITIEETGVGTFESFDVASSPNLVIEGNVLTIDPTNDLATDTAYHVEIPATAIEDFNGNPFAGISGTADPNWNFTTNIDGTPPTIDTLDPATGSTGVAFDAELTATFSELIDYGSGNITILNLTEATETVISIDDFQVIISGSELIIDTDEDFDPLDEYAVQLDAGVVIDYQGNPFAGILDVDTWSFEVLPDTTAPVIDTLSPANGASGVAPFGNLVMTFIDQEDIQTGSGDIVIREAGTDTVLQTIGVNDPEVTLSGPKEVTIAFSLPPGASVYVNVDAGAFEDPSGNPFAGISGTDTWAFGTATVAPAGPGAVSIFTAEKAGEEITTSTLLHVFNSAPRLSESHVLSNGSDIEMEAGHHLVIYNARFDSTSGGNRSEVQTNLSLEGSDLSAGWSQGYIRRASGADECITAGGAIVDVANEGDILQLLSYRTDTNPGDGAIRADASTGIQLLKLDDSWDYLSLSGHDGTGIDQTLPSSNSSWTTVEYTDVIEKDAGSFGDTSDGVVLVRQGHYLVFANTYAVQPSNRQSIIQRLTLGGTEVVGSMTSVYLRNDNSCQEGAASIGMVIETTSPNEVLKVEVTQFAAQANMYLAGDRTGLTIVKLPDSGDYIRLSDSIGGLNNNPTSPESLLYNVQDEVDASFTHTTDGSEVGVTVDGDYLFLACQYDGNNEVARVVSNQGWAVNGDAGLAAHGQTGSYGRADAGTSDVSGNWSGFITGLSASDFVESLVVQLGAGGNNTVDVIALQGLSISSLFGETPPSPYESWSGSFTGLEDASPTIDYDRGGLLTGIEWVVGGDPTDPEDDPGLAPTGAISATGTHMVFTYQRTDAANEDPFTDITAEYGSDLQGWTTAQDGVDGVVITATDGSPTDTVEVKIPVALAEDGDLFARLNVAIAVP